VEYSSKIGYDAHQMANFFRTLERQGQASGAAELPNFLSTHPNPGDRFNTVHQLATEWQKNNNMLQPQVNRNSYLRRIEGLIYGEDPKGGYRQNNVFYHPTLRFQFNTPQGWNYQNTPQQVQLASPDGKAILFLRLAQGNSLTDAANNFLQQNKMVTVESRETTVNGLRALAVVADIQQQQGALRTLQYYIQYGNNIYMLVGASAVANFNAYTNTFNATMQSFRELTDAARINVKPERIRLRTVNGEVSVQQALQGFGVPQNRLEEMALLNSMLLTDRLTSGTLIKVVERY
jgi:predicted Zn-dependent protease